MPIRPIRLFGDPVLRTPAAEVTTFDAELRHLVKDLEETMQDAGGVGLAAPQVGVGLRVFTYLGPDGVGHLINPDLAISGAVEWDDEGCLSIPDLVMDTPRPVHTVASGFDVHGEPIIIEGTHRLARCLQHETDHLDGILFIDRLEPDQRRLALKEIRSAEWAGQPGPIIRESPHRTYGRAT